MSVVFLRLHNKMEILANSGMAGTNDAKKQESEQQEAPFENVPYWTVMKIGSFYTDARVPR